MRFLVRNGRPSREKLAGLHRFRHRLEAFAPFQVTQKACQGSLDIGGDFPNRQVAQVFAGERIPQFHADLIQGQQRVRHQIGQRREQPVSLAV